MENIGITSVNNLNPGKYGIYAGSNNKYNLIHTKNVVKKDKDSRFFTFFQKEWSKKLSDQFVYYYIYDFENKERGPDYYFENPFPPPTSTGPPVTSLDLKIDSMVYNKKNGEIIINLKNIIPFSKNYEIHYINQTLKKKDILVAIKKANDPIYYKGTFEIYKSDYSKNKDYTGPFGT